MKNHSHLPADIELVDQETASLEFVVMGNNGGLEVLVSSVGVHRNLGLTASHGDWLQSLMAPGGLRPPVDARYVDGEAEYYFRLNAAIGIAERENTE